MYVYSIIVVRTIVFEDCFSCPWMWMIGCALFRGYKGCTMVTVHKFTAHCDLALQ